MAASALEGAMALYSVNEVTTDGREALLTGFINPSGIAAWVLQLTVLTTPGAIVTSLAIAVGLFTNYPDRPWIVLLAPILLLPLAFIAFIFMFLSTFTDLATEWLFTRTWGKPDPTKLLHRVGYFLLSVPVWIVIAFIFGSGGDANCSGPARYCS